ncbi:DUF4192 domain-containing protein [Microtetraspora malaysiensis]|uniref:DUF4192 domain-containing protein n=1 Tax=Microtetraspora malaysiensis TaxID=161358 RepID=A0ABW6SXY3_9ACTN
MTTIPTIRLSSPADLIAVVPYLLGFHPEASLVATVLDTENRTVGGTVRFDLPSDQADTPRLARHLTGILTRNMARQVMLIGYGTGAQVTPVIDAVTDALKAAGIEIVDALRAEEGRYWSYTCTEAGCCPPEGVPYEPTASAAVATAVFAGFVARPDRAALADTLAPVEGPDRDRVNAATRAACARVRTLTDADHDWYHEGADRIAAALERAQAEQELDADDVAWLGIRLTAIFVRDAAMTFIGRYDQETHVRLWGQIARRVPPEFAAAPLSLLAFTAFGYGDGSLARVAIERALSIDPGYRLAHLISMALDHGLPPSITSEVNCADMAGEIEAQARRYPQGARPTLPEGW